MALFLNWLIATVTETLQMGTQEEIETLVETTNPTTLANGLGVPLNFDQALALARELLEYVNPDTTLPGDGQVKNTSRTLSFEEDTDIIYESSLNYDGAFTVLVRDSDYEPVVAGNDPCYVRYFPEQGRVRLTYPGYSAEYQAGTEVWTFWIHEDDCDCTISFNGQTFVLDRTIPHPIIIRGIETGLIVDEPVDVFDPVVLTSLRCSGAAC